MSFQLAEPILVIGLGGAGSKLAMGAKQLLNSDCLLISNDQKDLHPGFSALKISTDSFVNPSMHLIRGCADKNSDEIQEKISKYSTIVMMANLAGKAGAAIAPIVSNLCKESDKNLISFAIMPFKFEKDRIFNSGVSLKRLKSDSKCTVVIDNDALLDCNPDLSPNSCHKITNDAISVVVNSLKSSSMPHGTNIASTSNQLSDVETSLKDSIQMLYEDAPPNSIKRSMLYVLGGNDIPVGILNSISNITSNIFGEDSTRIDMAASSSEQSRVVMLSSIQGETRFEKYDPLGMIPDENTLDWEKPDCSVDIDYGVFIDQIE